MRLMHTVEAAPALGGQSQVPATPGSVLARCDQVETYEIDRAHAITIKAIAVFSFQERNMIAPYCERGSAAFTVANRPPTLACSTWREFLCLPNFYMLAPTAVIHINF
jgi:hypothetical protein